MSLRDDDGVTVPRSIKLLWMVLSLTAVSPWVLPARSPPVTPVATARSCTADAEGQDCDDDDVCTAHDICQHGFCLGEPLECPPGDACHHTGRCDAQAGGCMHPAKADGTWCDDGDPCTRDDVCVHGVCTGGRVMSCAGKR